MAIFNSYVSHYQRVHLYFYGAIYPMAITGSPLACEKDIPELPMAPAAT